MKSVLRFWWIGIGVLTMVSMQQPAYAQDPLVRPGAEIPTVQRVQDTDPVDSDTQVERETDESGADVQVEVEVDDEESDTETRRERRSRHRDWEEGNAVVNFFGNSTLTAGDEADAVVSIVGSSTSEGTVKEAVVSILGDSRATGGTVGQAVVSIFGNTYVDTEVGEQVVAVFGNVELGPNARVDGEVVAVMGSISKHPDAQAKTERQVGWGGNWDGLRQWIRHCFMLGRPLALEPGLGWAWGVAIGFLGFYVLLSLMFSSAIERAVTTFEEAPGATILTSMLAVLATPVLFVLLMITIVGLAVIPFLGVALFAAGLFGKAAVLAALGRRVTRFAGASPVNHVAVATLVGGVIVLALYLVPVFGFILYKVLGILGLGVVLYMLVLMQRARRDEQQATLAAAGGVPIQTNYVSPTPAADSSTPTSTAFASTAEPTGSAPSTSGPAVPPAPAAPVVSPTALPRADFWIRMGALFIDFILVGVVLNVIVTFDVDNLFLLALATYGAVMWKLRGTTIGGIICNLRVVRQDGRELDWGTAVIRALSCFLSFVAAGLGFFWILFDRERQGWHDKIAGTIVVRDVKAKPLV